MVLAFVITVVKGFAGKYEVRAGHRWSSQRTRKRGDCEQHRRPLESMRPSRYFHQDRCVVFWFPLSFSLCFIPRIYLCVLAK